jgi:hypothetical protein
MFDKVSQTAERLATNVSRRAFLGRLGKGALGMAAAVGGLIAFPKQAQAGCYYSPACCIWDCGGSFVTNRCSKQSKHCRLVSDCADCGGTL